jgi:hypothetical protein
MISRKNVNGTDCLLKLVTRAPILQDRYLQIMHIMLSHIIKRIIVGGGGITLGDLCGWATVHALLKRRKFKNTI